MEGHNYNSFPDDYNTKSESSDVSRSTGGHTDSQISFHSPDSSSSESLNHTDAYPPSDINTTTGSGKSNLHNEGQSVLSGESYGVDTDVFSSEKSDSKHFSNTETHKNFTKEKHSPSFQPQTLLTGVEKQSFSQISSTNLDNVKSLQSNSSFTSNNEVPKKPTNSAASLEKEHAKTKKTSISSSRLSSIMLEDINLSKSSFDPPQILNENQSDNKISPDPNIITSGDIHTERKSISSSRLSSIMLGNNNFYRHTTSPSSHTSPDEPNKEQINSTINSQQQCPQSPLPPELNDSQHSIVSTSRPLDNSTGSNSTTYPPSFINNTDEASQNNNPILGLCTSI